MINAAYVNYNDKTIWNINYQAGLRFQRSYYKGTIADKTFRFLITTPARLPIFLKSNFSGHLFLKKLRVAMSFQLNFSRKINRPNFFQLIPFVMFADQQNYHWQPTAKT